ncbi:DMT family transporter [Erythrobacter litoralis]|uniref:DMT family transporter n=1 Tax=Erythrobacter litoralis TaxID=39960 RepID=UPI0024361474|nr:DMT family transporter [Erythrobacter litoralis]MDG6080052.1 DMT family transporter [Erythrobacter litoralis]
MSSPRGEESLLAPRNLVAFLLVSLIWGGTWLVIRDQLSIVPAQWSITYRFIVASAGMFVLAAVRGEGMWLAPGGQKWALILGVLQFTLNFTFVYNAERFITSGLVAVMFALLVVPNAVLGRMLLGQPITRAFVLGSSIAAIGVALLFAQEYRASPATLSEVLLGAALTIGGILSASFANIAQAMEGAKRQPLVTLLAWSMLWGTAINASMAVVIEGAPVFDARPSYGLGILYLGLLGSVVTFPLYYGLVRKIGAGKAAYSSVIVPVVAMVLSTLFEGFVWGWLPASGAVLVLAGMIVALRGRAAPPLRRATPEP